MDVDESMSQEQRKAAVRAQLVRVFGEAAADMTDYTDTLWAQAGGYFANNAVDK